MRILVFGRNGQLARCLIEEAGAELTALGSADCDLMTPGAGAAEIAAIRPDIVINAAAYTNVDKAESERDEAQRLNATAPGELANAAAEISARFIHISTDYVFDGAATAPYPRTAPTNPINHYGATKRAGEENVLAADETAIILRTSWVFSEYGENFVKTMLRLGAERDGLSIVDDQIGGPTSARDIAHAALTIAGKLYRGAGGEGIYHFQGAPAVSWAGFASVIFKEAGLQTSVTPIPTADYKTAAERPLRTILDCSRIERDFGLAQPDWRGALAGVVRTLTTAP